MVTLFSLTAMCLTPFSIMIFVVCSISSLSLTVSSGDIIDSASILLPCKSFAHIAPAKSVLVIIPIILELLS